MPQSQTSKPLRVEPTNEANVGPSVKKSTSERDTLIMESNNTVEMDDAESEGHDLLFQMSHDPNPVMADEGPAGEFGFIFADHKYSSSNKEPSYYEGNDKEEESNDEGSSELVGHDGSAFYYLVKEIKNISEKGGDDILHSHLVNETHLQKLLKYYNQSYSNNTTHCSVPSLFQSWENGMVTQMGIPLKRDCHRLSLNPSQEVKKSKLKSQVKKWKFKKPWETLALEYKHMSCTEMRQDFENNFYVSQLEKEFPIAYIFVVYANAGQVLRLLKSIYRPHNLYCIHPDARQGEAFASFFKAVAKCLDNVFVVSKPVKVYYGHISITNAQLHCMQDLVQYPETRWKYVINLCGREIPLKTNREIVESLRKLKGYTALDRREITKSFWAQRFKYKFQLEKPGKLIPTENTQSKPPKGIKLYKSMNFIAASRAFVYFILHDPLPSKLHKFLNSVYAPEEHFYSSLYALKQAEGARPPKGLLSPNTMPIVDGFIWVNNKEKKQNVWKYCPGRHVVHTICILTAADLEKVERLGVHSKRPVFFFNKYFLEWDPTPMDCMEERLVRTNMDEYRRDCIDDAMH